MRSDENLDLFRHSPAALVEAFREAARAAMLNPYETLEQRQARAAHYEREADRLAAKLGD